jgi:hypothetical protein
MTPGQKGGLACVTRHGREHMAEIGRKGFATLCARYFGGSRDEAMRWLHDRARFYQVERAASARLAETGEACIELDGDVPAEDLDGDMPF